MHILIGAVIVLAIVAFFPRFAACVFGLAIVIGVINSINSYNAAQHAAVEEAKRSEIAELEHQYFCAKPTTDEMTLLEKDFRGCPQANSSHNQAAAVRR